LGNEAEALRLAQSELEELTDAIRKELDQHDPSLSREQSTPGSQPSSERSTNNDPGQEGKSSSDQQEVSQEASQPGQQPGQAPTLAGGEDAREGQQPQPGSQRSAGTQNANQSLAEALQGILNQTNNMSGGPGTGPHELLTGEQYGEWSNRMSDLEEMLTTPELRNRAATIRERARQERIEIKRHSKQPNWELVRTSIYGPMLELENLIAEEIARRDPNKKLIPIDRDPVPDKYADLVREYYEQLSRQRASGN
jgi:hypothetical protein